MIVELIVYGIHGCEWEFVVYEIDGCEWGHICERGVGYEQ